MIAADGQQTIAENNQSFAEAEQQQTQQQQPQGQQPPPQQAQQHQQQQRPPLEIPEEVKTALQEYPEIAKAVDFVSEVKVRAVQQQFQQTMYNAAAVIIDLRQKQAEADKKIADMEFNQGLLGQVPDAYSLVKTKEFREWLPKQRPETQACFTSTEAWKVVNVMQLYKLHEMRVKKQAADTADKQKADKIRQQNMGSGNRNISRPSPAAAADKNDFNAGFSMGE